MAQSKLRPYVTPVAADGEEYTGAPVVNQALIDLLRSWRKDGDAHEQRDAWEYLKRVLDEDRLSNRKLFS